METDIQRSDERDDGLRRYDYDEETLFVADLGTEAGGATVETVDGAAVVVAEDGEQFEFALPGRARATSINSGVLTIEVDR